MEDCEEFEFLLKAEDDKLLVNSVYLQCGRWFRSTTSGYMSLIRQINDNDRTEMDNNQHSETPLMQVERREAEWLMVSRTHTLLHSRGQSTRVGDQCRHAIPRNAAGVSTKLSKVRECRRSDDSSNSGAVYSDRRRKKHGDLGVTAFESAR